MEFHDRLKLLRISKNYSQEYVAKQLHVSRQAVSRWETGKTIPDLKTIEHLSELYEVSLDELISGKSYENKEVQQDSIITEYFKMMIHVILMIVSAVIPLLGLSISVFVLYKNKKCNWNNKYLYALCILCIIFNAYNLHIIILGLFHNYGYGSVTPL